MWIESSILVGDHTVGLSVQRLGADERDRAAAELAWLVLTWIHKQDSVEDAASCAVIETVLSRHVMFDVAEESIDSLGGGWWGEATGRALVEFIRANGLAPALHRHLDAITRADHPGPLAS